MSVLKVIGGLVVLSIAATNIGYAISRREIKAELAAKINKPKVEEAK